MRITTSLSAVFFLATASMASAASTSLLVQTDSSTVHDQIGTGLLSESGVVTGGNYVAIADIGVLKAYTEMAAPVFPGPCCGYAHDSLGAYVSFTDTVTVDAPLGVSSGSFLGSILVSGSLTPLANVNGSGNVGFAVLGIKVELPDLGTTPFNLSMTLQNYGGFLSGGGTLNGQRYTGPYTGKFDFNIPFETLVGQTVKVSLSCASLGTNVQAGDTAGGICAFDHSVYWGGASQIKDQNGNAFAPNAISGSNGFDFANAAPGAPAVPEPASWAMLICGFGLTGAAMRQRRRQAA